MNCGAGVVFNGLTQQGRHGFPGFILLGNAIERKRKPLPSQRMHFRLPNFSNDSYPKDLRNVVPSV